MQINDAFILICKSERIALTPEHRFDAHRRWRFDFADVERKIAIEIEGGVYTNGRHTRGKGYINDCEKYNSAVVQGWRVLRYASIEQLRTFVYDYTALVFNTNK